MARLRDRYANALMDISIERGSLEEDLKQAVSICDAFKASDVQEYLIHPHIPNDTKKQFFQRVFHDNLSNNMMGFLHLMVNKNRESLIVISLEEYIKRANRKLGRIEARVVSATELSDTQLESIRKSLSKQTKMEVQINAEVDKDVIGGFYILVDGRIYDATVRNELNMIRKRLRKEVVNDS